MTSRADEEHLLHLVRSLGTSRIFLTNQIFVEPKDRLRARASSREGIWRQSAAEGFPKVSLNNENVLSITGGEETTEVKGVPDSFMADVVTV